MATVQQLEQALIAADAAGNTADAQALSDAIREAYKDTANLIPDAQIPFTQRQRPEPTLGEQATGVGETALTLATGATGGAVGYIAGALEGLAGQILSGEFGTPESVKLVQKAAEKLGGKFTYAPRTETGREYTKEAAGALSLIPPVLPAVPSMIAAAPKGVTVGQAVSGAATPAMTAVRQAIPRRSQPTSGSLGAAETQMALQRVTTARAMPVPFEGKSALTAGQATRDFAQLQFEKETAKLGDIGAPLRERAQNQTATFVQNFDAMIDRLEPISSNKMELGAVVDKALVNKAEVMRAKIRAAYKKAREGGEMQAPVDMDDLPATMADLDRFKGVSPNVSAIEAEALRLGAITRDANGNFVPGKITLESSEILRQFVNEATDWMDKRQSTFARKVNQSIDASTENKGGEAYKAARKLRSNFANEFENVGLTSKLVGTKGKTNERAIAISDVFDKIVLLSSVEEMNKLRGTLLTAGQDGKNAWADLKAMGVQHIKDKSLSASQMDAAGNPLLSPDKLQKVVKSLDAEGKLESLYGKKQAQTFRDLADLSTDIYTAPPGAVNFSNTSSAIQNAIDTLVTYGVSGLPVAGKATLTQALRYVKDHKTRTRIKEALAYKPKMENQ